MFAYPGTVFFANVMAEKLPDVGYAELKQALIDNFDFILQSSPSSEENRNPVAGIGKLDERGLQKESALLHAVGHSGIGRIIAARRALRGEKSLDAPRESAWAT